MTDTARPAPARRSRRLISAVVGLALIAAAIVAISTHTDVLGNSLRAARSASWWRVVLAIALPAVNWLLMSLSFWLLMRRHGQIRFGEMACLIGAAWLLNYLPLRPGLIGRIAYHKTVNRIDVTKSVAVTVLSIISAGVAIGAMLGACVACSLVEASPLTRLILVCLVPPALALLATVLCARFRGPWWIASTILLRYIDLLVWVARYFIVFAIVGHPLTLIAAAAIASVGQIAMLIPLVGNGLGLREWAVGLVSASLPPGILSASGKLTTSIGLLADLVNRTAEVLCAVPIGLISGSLLAKRKSL